MNRAFKRLVVLAALLAAGSTVRGAGFTNVVLVMADDQGWYETGYNGHPYVQTPVLDSMAAQGLRFDRFYAAGPNCSPTRGSIMTGRNSIRFGCLDPSYTLRLEEVMLPRVLKNNGYRTGHFGKWHLGPVKSASPVTPAACGFDEYISHDNFFELDPMLSRNGATPEQRTGESSEIVVSDALEFIGRVKNENKPFLAVVWFGSPHSPYSGLPADVALYSSVPTDEMRNRFAEITAMDRAIGQLRSGLAALGLTTNTMLWYCSDNGVPSGTTPMGPLRGSKGTIYENGLRVPAILEWPAVVKTPAITSVPVVTSDMMPTILDFLGIPYPDPTRKLDGVSMKALIENPVGVPARSKPIGFWRRSTSAYLSGAFWFPNKADLKGNMPTADSAGGIQFENRVYPVAKTTGFPGNAAWLDYPLKYVVDSGNDRLFNVQIDSQEATNLAALQPADVQRLKGALRDWQRDVEVSMTAAEYGFTNPVPTTNVLLHYRLDESSGQTAHDSAPDDNSARNATTSDSSPQWQPTGGVIGGALRFSPTNQTDVSKAFSYTAATAIVGNYPFTIALWVRGVPQTWNQDCAFLGDATQDTSYFQLSIGKDAPYTARAVARNTTIRTAASPDTLLVTDDQWHHLAGVFTATQRTLYLDGVAVGIDTNTVNFVSNNKRFALGALMRSSATDAHAGWLDDVGLWNTALTPERIALIHGLGRYAGIDLADPSIDALLALYTAKSGFAVAAGSVWIPTNGLIGEPGSSGVTNNHPYLVVDASGEGLIRLTRPELHLTQLSEHLISLSWHSGFADWILEEATDLASADWAESVETVEDDGVTRSVSYSIQNMQGHFFRLKAP